MLAVEGLGAPEATGGDGAPLRTLGEGSSGGGVWGDRHASGVGEGSEESRKQGRQSHEGDEDGEEEKRSVGKEGQPTAGWTLMLWGRNVGREKKLGNWVEWWAAGDGSRRNREEKN